ncbi:MAG: hypothetical protein ACXWLG_02630 [Myxococcaceae bacterium]
MRVALVLLSATLLLAGCKREAQEAAAKAKGAAADAQRAANEAAARARSAADQAAATARSAADQARTAADDAASRAHAAADQARGAASSAGDSARQGLDSAGQSIREMTAGDQLEGELVSAGGTELSIRPRSGPVETLHTDAKTRWILHGAAAGREGFGSGSTVRVTYIVHNGQRVATQVEARPR